MIDVDWDSDPLDHESTMLSSLLVNRTYLHCVKQKFLRAFYLSSSLLGFQKQYKLFPISNVSYVRILVGRRVGNKEDCGAQLLSCLLEDLIVHC